MRQWKVELRESSLKADEYKSQAENQLQLFMYYTQKKKGVGNGGGWNKGRTHSLGLPNINKIRI